MKYLILKAHSKRALQDKTHDHPNYHKIGETSYIKETNEWCVMLQYREPRTTPLINLSLSVGNG